MIDETVSNVAKFPNETILQELPVCLPNPSVWQLSAAITMNSFGRMIVRDAVTVERLTLGPSGDNSDRTRFHWPGESRVERPGSSSGLFFSIGGATLHSNKPR